MPLNLIKTYSQLLDIVGLTSGQRIVSLKSIFKRDIEDNHNFKFQSKQIRPLKKEGQDSMDTLFHHLTTREDKDEKGKLLGTRSFELARSQRLHWVKHHIEERKNNNMDIFSFKDRIKGKNIIRTYIYDIEQEYVIILEPQRSGTDYYLLTAYYLNEPRGKEQIETKRRSKLDEVY